jgi:adenylosuccinate synthase
MRSPAPGEALRYGDLPHTARALDKLEASRTALLGEFAAIVPAHAEAAQELAMLQDDSLARRWLGRRGAVPGAVAARQRGSHRRAAGSPRHRGVRGRAGGAAGRVARFSSAHDVEHDLDRGGRGGAARRGHRRWWWCWCRCGTWACCAATSRATARARCPTHDRLLDARLAEPHNADEGWQGVFRRGHPDAVLLRYALDAVGAARRVGREPSRRGRWHAGCAGARRIAARTVRASPRCHSAMCPISTHQHRLTQQLLGAQPLYEPGIIATPQEWIARIEALSGLAVRYGAFGPTRETVRALQPLGVWPSR